MEKNGVGLIKLLFFSVFLNKNSDKLRFSKFRGDLIGDNLKLIPSILPNYQQFTQNVKEFVILYN